MPLIVDAFNVLHMTGVLPPDLSGLDVDELRGVISLSRFRHQRVTLVCDGVRPINSIEMMRANAAPSDDMYEDHGPDNIVVDWSGPSLNADSVIETLVAQDTAPRRLVVVTSDRRLGRVVRKRRVGVMPSERFLKTLSDDFRDNMQRAGTLEPGGRPIFAYDVPLRNETVRWWNTYFGLDPDNPKIAGRDVQSSTDHLTTAPATHAPDEIKSPDSEPTSESPRIDNEPPNSIRWWLCYFGFDPDQLPEEMLVPATNDEDRVVIEGSATDATHESEDPSQHQQHELPDHEIDIDDIDPEVFLN